MRLTSSLAKRSSNKAATLIIVLAFVVLLSGLAVAYLSRATTDRQLAHTSFHDTDADLLARSALDIVVGDFKQEIASGSSVLSVSGKTVFIPTSPANVVPMRSGNPAIPGVQTTDPIPNLIRRSIRLNGVGELNAMPTPGISSRASATNSTAASANGRSVSLAKWNSHYLIPRADPAAPPGVTTPRAEFIAPDWVLVTRNGPAPFPVWNSGLKDPTSTNTTYAVGRYAYAVYDEGGLLDINVAGYPSPTPAATSLTAGPSVRDVGRKGVLAFADLTALPTTPGNYMSMTAINTLIGFRNYATMQLTGVSGLNFPPFSPSAVSNFFNYFTMPSPIPAASPLQIGTSKDFGVVNAVSTGLLSDSSLRTDQNFINRGELIKFLKSTGIANVNTLQYLGTFSREQNKPTFQLSTVWPFINDTSHARLVLPRFYLGNLNEVVSSGNAANIRQYFGLQFASANGPIPCDNQVRWKYVGNQDFSNTTPLPAIPPFPSNLTSNPIDFFQYINYALWGRIDADSTHIASTLSIGASIIDQYDADQPTTGIYFGSNPATCDPTIAACLVYGADTNPPPPPLPCVPSAPGYVASNVFINRPLRSVGEFGYAYNLLDAFNNNNGVRYLTDFKDPYDSTTNPDPALLDFFTYNSAPIRSGIVSLNTRQPPVLAAILKGAIFNKNNNDADYTSGVVGVPGVNTPAANLDATNAANSLVNETWRTVNTRAFSRADIARLASASVITNPPFTSDEEARDTIARALSEVVQTRTWGLLIDLVAQTGHYTPNATGLDDFIVEGEKRYWLHVAIDRFEGGASGGPAAGTVTVLDQQLEEVIE